MGVWEYGSMVSIGAMGVRLLRQQGIYEFIKFLFIDFIMFTGARAIKTGIDFSYHPFLINKNGRGETYDFPDFRKRFFRPEGIAGNVRPWPGWDRLHETG